MNEYLDFKKQLEQIKLNNKKLKKIKSFKKVKKKNKN